MEGTEHEAAETTAPPTPKHSRSSLSSRKGLIATEKTKKQSAKRRTALDNRFHRTLRRQRISCSYWGAGGEPGFGCPLVPRPWFPHAGPWFSRRSGSLVPRALGIDAARIDAAVDRRRRPLQRVSGTPWTFYRCFGMRSA